MHKIKYLLVCVLLISGLFLVPTCNAQGDARAKSSVLYYFNNNARTAFDESINDIANEFLYKKFAGLYTRVDSAPYANLFVNRSLLKYDAYDMAELVAPAGAKYFVYLELGLYQEDSRLHLTYLDKPKYAKLLLRIIDVEQKRELLHNFIPAYTDEESRQAWEQGDKGVALEELRTALFRAVEDISTHLPL